MFDYKLALNSTLESDQLFFTVRDQAFSLSKSEFYSFLNEAVNQLQVQYPEHVVWNTLSESQKLTISTGNFAANSFTLSAWQKIIKNSFIRKQLDPMFILFLKDLSKSKAPLFNISFSIV